MGKAEEEVVEMTGEEGEPEKLMVIEGRGTTAGEGGPGGGTWMAKVLAKFSDSGGFETGGIGAVGQWACVRLSECVIIHVEMLKDLQLFPLRWREPLDVTSISTSPLTWEHCSLTSAKLWECSSRALSCSSCAVVMILCRLCTRWWGIFWKACQAASSVWVMAAFELAEKVRKTRVENGGKRKRGQFR